MIQNIRLRKIRLMKTTRSPETEIIDVNVFKFRSGRQGDT